MTSWDLVWDAATSWPGYLFLGLVFFGSFALGMIVSYLNNWWRS